MQIESLNHSMAEYLDIVDENGIPTGETVERETAHAKGIRHRTVHLWLVRKKDGKLQVLLQRRQAQGVFSRSVRYVKRGSYSGRQ